MSSGNARKYEKFHRSLKAFVSAVYGKSLTSYFFKDIDAKFITDYAFHLKRRGVENGNQGCLVTRLRQLRALCNYAAKLGMPGAGITAFDSLGDMIKWPETTSRAVSAKTISLLENIDRSLFSAKEQLHLDLFLFSYYTGGMANVDVCNLTWDCVQEDKIVYERIKFPKTAKPLLIPQSRALLRKYKGTGYGNYVFPVFTRKHTDSVKRSTRVNQISTLVTRTLSKACRILRIKEHVTWYSARGSFISRMVDDGNSPYAVAEMAGNSPMTIWKNYYKNTEREKLAERMKAVL
nr:phage integrase SAM-like domain-containing protein [Alistipes onderdonkii]